MNPSKIFFFITPIDKMNKTGTSFMKVDTINNQKINPGIENGRIYWSG